MINNKKKVFDIRGKFDLKKTGFIVTIKINKKTCDFLKGYLNSKEINTSETWKDKNGNDHKYYYGGFNLNELSKTINGTDYNNALDNFGSRNLLDNLALLRSYELLTKGKTSFLFEQTLFIEVKNCLKSISDFLIKINKNISKGLIEIKGYEIINNLKEKEISTDV